jgi:hypothetical protein
MANLSILHIGNVPKDDRGELFEGLKYASGIRELATDYKAKDNTSLASVILFPHRMLVEKYDSVIALLTC